VAEAIATVEQHRINHPRVAPAPDQPPSSAWWRQASASAATAHDHADLAWVARACWHRTSAPEWQARFAQERLAAFALLGHTPPAGSTVGGDRSPTRAGLAIRATRATLANPMNNVILSGQLAPDRRNLSVVYGLAGIAMLGCAVHDATPDVRSFE
jgi:hypothetical protein